jgi:hypothetical protein
MTPYGSKTAARELIDKMDSETERRPNGLLNPGGGSLETTASVQALFEVCRYQQAEIEALRARLDGDGPVTAADLAEENRQREAESPGYY